jgi:hypothetical protein
VQLKIKQKQNYQTKTILVVISLPFCWDHVLAEYAYDNLPFFCACVKYFTAAAVC